MKTIVAIVLVLTSFLACADGVTMAFKNGVAVPPAIGLTSSLEANTEASGSSFRLFRDDIANNTLQPGSLFETKVDGSTGQAYASFAVYGVARSVGQIGTWGVHDITGGNFRAYLDNDGWAAGVHADCLARGAGGTCIGVNIEFPQVNPGNQAIGINIQPDFNSRNLVGLQFQNPRSYKYAIIAQNTNYVFGQVDAVPFGFRFNPMTQKLEFFRDIGQPGETRRGAIDMNFEAPDSQLNK
jgi:hypothetical protein